MRTRECETDADDDGAAAVVADVVAVAADVIGKREPISVCLVQSRHRQDSNKHARVLLLPAAPVAATFAPSPALKQAVRRNTPCSQRKVVRQQ